MGETIAKKGLFRAFYTDRGSHYFHTPKAGGKVDKTKLTQVGRALQQLGVTHIPSYSPEARGRMERVFKTLQSRLPPELRLAEIATVEAANRYLEERFIPDYNARFAVAAAEPGSAFIPYAGRPLEDVLCIQEDRQVGRDTSSGGACPCRSRRSATVTITSRPFDRIAREALKISVQHFAEAVAPRRHALLTAATLSLESGLTDATLLMFDKLMGSLSRKAERRSQEKAAKSARDLQEKLRALTSACTAMIGARENHDDPFIAIERQMKMGWSQFVTFVTETEAIVASDQTDPKAELLRRYATVRKIAAPFLEAQGDTVGKADHRRARRAQGALPNGAAISAGQGVNPLHSARLAVSCHPGWRD